MLKKYSNNYVKKSISECKGDGKAMWRKMKEITNEKQSEVDKIEVNGKEIMNPKQIAETLNNYFIESKKELNSKIKDMPPPTRKRNRNERQNNKFKFKEITYTDIERILKDIKTNAYDR